MNKLWLKRLVFICSILMINNAFSSHGNDSCCECEQGYIIDEHKVIGAYNAPEKLCLTCPVGGYVEGSFLWWEAREPGLNIATNTDADQKTSFISIPFSYAPGFKVEAGLDTKRDNWKASLLYTRLSLDQKVSKIKNENDSMQPLWAILSPSEATQTTEKSSGKWKLSFNTFDASLDRAFYAGKKVTLSPCLGIKAGWVDQDIKILYSIKESGASSDEYVLNITSESDSWVIGPRAGVSCDFILGKNIKLFGKTAASLLYQSFDVSYRQKKDSVTDTFAKDSPGYINPFLEIGLGLNWGFYMANCGWHADISASYDFNVFWNQNISRALNNTLKTFSDGSSGDLMLHGLTLSIRTDF